MREFLNDLCIDQKVYDVDIIDDKGEIINSSIHIADNYESNSNIKMNTDSYTSIMRINITNTKDISISFPSAFTNQT